MASITDQNWVVWNQGKNPLVNFNFMLRVEMLYDLPCKSIRAFSRELEYDYIQEGGLNDYVHMRRKPVTRPFTLEVERYVGVDYMDPLPLGADLALPVLLFVSRNHDQFIPGVVARTYVFTGCTVMKKTYGDLVGDQSGLLVETTTLGYREMLCVDIPWSEVGDDISKDVQTLPTSASTTEKDVPELKNKAQRLYDKARAAKEKADSEYNYREVGDLLWELEKAKASVDFAARENPEAKGLQNRIQNSITNLKLRRDSTSDAQKDCTKQHDLCKKANDEVQRMPDSDVSGVQAGYEEVQRYAEQTEYYERQVAEFQQYREAAQALVKEAEALVAGMWRNNPGGSPGTGENPAPEPQTDDAQPPVPPGTGEDPSPEPQTDDAQPPVPPGTGENPAPEPQTDDAQPPVPPGTGENPAPEPDAP